MGKIKELCQIEDELVQIITRDNPRLSDDEIYKRIVIISESYIDHQGKGFDVDLETLYNLYYNL